MTPNQPNAAARIAQFACNFDSARLTAHQLLLSGRSLADTYAVAFAGRNEAAPQAALRYLKSAGLLSHDSSGATLVGLWGRPEYAAPEIAAWWNGVAGHVLDYDDVTVPMRGHPSVVLWPALLALAEQRDLPGQRVAAAFVVGLEVICKLSRGIAMRHYEKGWHSTASIGVIGSTVACAYLLQLDARQIAHAIGMAVAQAAGSRENVGTEGKSFQAGHACGAAVRAASLAAEGFTAGEMALDGPNGYLALYGNGEAVETVLAGLGDSPLEIERSGLDVKQYPMCYATHRSIDAVLALRSAHGVRLEDVETVEVVSSRGGLLPLVHPRPSLGLEGKFSLPYAIAAALSDGAVRLTSFTDAAVLRPEIQRFFEQVRWREDDGPAAPRWADVTLHLRDGRTLSQRIEQLHGSASQPLNDVELSAKVEDCLDWGGAAAERRDGALFLKTCLGFHRMSTRALLASLSLT